jgi:hypothetical protein
MQLNPDRLTAVIAYAKEKSASNEACLRAIDRAVKMLIEREWYFDFATGALTIWGSNQVYHANGVCQCAAYSAGHLLCKHRIAARLLVRYFENERLAAVEAEEMRAAANGGQDATAPSNIELAAEIAGNAEAANEGRCGEDAGSQPIELAVAASNTATANEPEDEGILPAHPFCAFCLFEAIDFEPDTFGPVLHDRCAELLYPRPHGHYCYICGYCWNHSDGSCTQADNLICLDCLKVESTDSQWVCSACNSDTSSGPCVEHPRAKSIELTSEQIEQRELSQQWSQIIRDREREIRDAEPLSEADIRRNERETAPLIKRPIKRDVKVDGCSI